MRINHHDRLLLPLFVAFLVLIGHGTARAQGAIETTAEHAIIIDADSGAVLFEKAADELTPPASMSKIMTMIMVFERLQRGELRLDDEFFISEDAWRRGGAASGGSTMYAEVNSSIRLEDLIRGVIVQSGNDACIALAEGIAGSEAAFGDLMTQRARELGLTRSRFVNATGLPDPDHLSTARELAMLALHQIKNLGEYYHYYAETEFTWNGITQRNRNPLLYQNVGADGLKTGYISEAGYGLVASAVRNNKRLILVLNGLDSAKDRANEARKLLDWGFRNFRPYTMFTYGQQIAEARVWGGTQNWVSLTANSEIRVMLSAQNREDVSAQLVYQGPVRAPISKGDEVAKLRFVADGLTVAEFPLFAEEDIPESGVIDKALDTLMVMVLGG